MSAEHDLSATPYDDVPYESHPFSQTHPNRLSTVAGLFGVATAKLNRCRILELGCCSGGNLLPMAELYAESQFVGVDLSKRQIQDGQERLKTLGYQNVVLRHQNILEFGEDEGKFDYIITHGVFSWAPRNVQDKILQICRDHLSPNGVAYISYNTYPGWRLRGTIRDIMSYRAKDFQSPQEKLREARALLDFLANAVPAEGNPYGMLLSKEVNHLRPKQDWYLIHEYLEEFNEPEYFHQFMERAQKFNLQYLGEADYSSMLASNFPADVQRKLEQLGGDIIATEQYMDLVRNRLFRQTLLCHKDIQLDRQVGAERIFNMYVASNSAPAEKSSPVNLQSNDIVHYERPGSSLTTREPIVKAAIQQLRESWPRVIPFKELLAAARGKLYPGISIFDADRSEMEERALALPLLRCYATTHVDLHSQPPPVAYDLSEYPRTTKYARLQAKTGAVVTNLWHETTRLSDIERRVLALLDGETDRTGVLDKLTAAVASNELTLQQQGRPITDSDQIRQILADAFPNVLMSIARKGLLIA